VNRNTVNRWEKIGRAKVETLEAAAEVLKCTVSELIVPEVSPSEMVPLADQMRALFRQAKFQAIIECLEGTELREALLGNYEAARLLADSLVLVGRPEDAGKIFAELCNRYPNDVDAHFNLGVCLFRCGRLTDAIAAYERTLGLAPQHATARIDLLHAHQAIEEQSLKQADKRFSRQ
jgi:tetratricopeptide (TPR) repeat protein